MGNMFDGCSSLTDLDLTNFDTSKVTSLSNMFQNCTNLKTLNIRSPKPQHYFILQVCLMAARALSS